MKIAWARTLARWCRKYIRADEVTRQKLRVNVLRPPKDNFLPLQHGEESLLHGPTDVELAPDHEPDFELDTVKIDVMSDDEPPTSPPADHSEPLPDQSKDVFLNEANSDSPLDANQSISDSASHKTSLVESQGHLRPEVDSKQEITRLISSSADAHDLANEEVKSIVNFGTDLPIAPTRETSAALAPTMSSSDEEAKLTPRKQELLHSAMKDLFPDVDALDVQAMLPEAPAWGAFDHMKTLRTDDPSNYPLETRITTASRLIRMDPVLISSLEPGQRMQDEGWDEFLAKEEEEAGIISPGALSSTPLTSRQSLGSSSLQILT